MKTFIFAAFVALATSAGASQTECSTDANARDSHGNTALMVAAAQGEIAQVQHLIEKGLEVNARGRIGNTALIYAAQEGHVEIVKILIDAGANIAAENEYLVTAGSLAKGYGHRDVAVALGEVVLLADNGATTHNKI